LDPGLFHLTEVVAEAAGRNRPPLKLSPNISMKETGELLSAMISRAST